jgi:copper resistance protein D
VYLQGLANFVDDLLGGIGLVALSTLIGSLVFGLVVLRSASRAPAAPVDALRVCVTWIGRGALAVAIIQCLRLFLKGVLLQAALGQLPWGAFFATVQVRAGLASTLLAVGIVVVARSMATAPGKRGQWWSVTAIALFLVITGAWLVHGVGRLENRGTLMTVTAVHEFVAAVWVGGVLQLLLLWRRGRRQAEVKAFFPVAVARFSAVGMFAVVILVASGTGLAWTYVGSINGMFGTAYGSLVAAKVVLLLLTLGFAFLNLRAGRTWRVNQESPAVLTRVPLFIEAETLLLVAILFVAATVSSQPPAADIPERTARASEVLAMFSPRIPPLESSSHEALLAGEGGRLAVVDRVPSAAATEWSDYNHNVSGLFISTMALLAFASYAWPDSFARWWPGGFIALAVFLFFRSDAESWPLGPIGFWESTFGNSEVLQHRLATLLAFSLGMFELRARSKKADGGWSPFVFPALCAVGGVLLLTHAHLAFEIKSDYLIQSTHLVMGLMAVVLATGRWLELRFTLAGSMASSRISGLIATTAMLMVGYILVVYKEPLY